ncbi:unnamed protein product [Paramecium primaurelia]|uniref:Uncharacterized protein n=1 Tax=Paramecium primaurelia TaxID=5886 RepID=A0A8S1K2G0_PARPR|nr:unnamed protein product [Paramecium primaurelia]
MYNDEIQFELHKQQQQTFQRGNKLSQLMIVPSLTTSTEKAQITINKFMQLYQPTNNKEPNTKEDIRKMMRRISQQKLLQLEYSPIKESILLQLLLKNV